MAIVSRKISSFPQLPSLSGDEFLMVAYKGKSYKIPVSMLTGNAIQSITQRISTADGADNPITMTVGSGEDAAVYMLHVFNGKQGSQGPTGDQGPKGLTGDTAIALYGRELEVYDDEHPEGTIYDSLEDIDDVDLSQLILSAAQGVELNSKLELLKEKFVTQEEYDDLVAANEIDPSMKYFIWES